MGKQFFAHVLMALYAVVIQPSRYLSIDEVDLAVIIQRPCFSSLAKV
jgi:hypothetical protein